jgi:hypothetical protein
MPDLLRPWPQAAFLTVNYTVTSTTDSTSTNYLFNFLIKASLYYDGPQQKLGECSDQTLSDAAKPLYN